MNGDDRDLDTAALESSAVVAAVLERFDWLAPGESFVLSGRDRMAPLLRALQRERPGRFEWHVLEARERHRVHVQRRATCGTRSITEYLDVDHERLSAMTRRILELIRLARIREAAVQLAELACGLEYHMTREEVVLFPAMKALESSHLQSLLEEHDVIRTLLGRAVAASEKDDWNSVVGAIDSLDEKLLEHNGNERAILYPLMDRIAGSPAAVGRLVCRMQAVRPRGPGSGRRKSGRRSRALRS